MLSGLSHDPSGNLAFTEAVLELPCIHNNRSASYQLVNLPKEEDDILLFHKLKVHNSYNVATHFGLEVHFCTKCGHYGQPAGKSIGLAQPCAAPSRQGRLALRSILKGKWPTYVGKNAKDKVPVVPRNVMDAILYDQS